jgi:DNA-binding protein HU-beta
MKKSELISIMAQKTGLSEKDARKGLNALVESIVEAVKAGERVSLMNFGTFDCYYRQGRPGSNPRTGEPMAVPARYSPRFKAGKAFKAALKA